MNKARYYPEGNLTKNAINQAIDINTDTMCYLGTKNKVSNEIRDKVRQLIKTPFNGVTDKEFVAINNY